MSRSLFSQSIKHNINSKKILDAKRGLIYFWLLANNKNYSHFILCFFMVDYSSFYFFLDEVTFAYYKMDIL